MRRTHLYGLMALAALALGGAASTQPVTPAPAIDQPRPPLAGPPSNQPPRQLQPEPDAISDPAMTNARNPPRRVGRDRADRPVAPPNGADATTLSPAGAQPHG